MGENIITKGKALIAEPFMFDSTFGRSVICICEHDAEDGTVGFVINKKTPYKISQLIEEINDFEAPTFFGGPVSPGTLHYLHNVGDLLDGSIQIKPGIFWGGHFEKLIFLINSELIKPSNIKFFLGYSGWEAGQLDEELIHGSWIVDDIDPNYIFKTKPRKLWSQILSNKGNTYSVIAQMPNSTRIN